MMKIQKSRILGRTRKLIALSGSLMLLAATQAMAGASPAPDAVPLEVLEPAQRTETIRDFPATLGMIFLEGEITSPPGGAVVDDLGQPVPFDWEVTGWWPPDKKSVRWLQLHFRASGDRRYFFVPGAAPAVPEGAPLAAESDGSIVVDTGPLQTKLAPGNAPVFTSATLDGKPILAPDASFFEFVDDEGRALVCEGWQPVIEENTPLRAVIRAEGTVGLPGQDPLLKLLVRYQFFAGESFVRLLHTFVWMERSLDPGANRIGLRLRPEVGETGSILVGLSDYDSSAEKFPFDPQTDLAAFQSDAEQFRIVENGREVATGKHLGGWIAVENGDGRGVSVSLKNAWQTYPTTLAVRRGDIDVGMWPAEAGRFSFEERDIMPDSLYYDKQWKHQVAWTKEGGPTPFNTRDIEPAQAAEFIAQLQAQAAADGDSPGQRVVGFLPPELQERLRALPAGAPVTDGLRARLAHGMNAFLEKPDFYTAEAWTGIELKPKAKELLDQGIPNLDRGQLVWLNRLLIESAFPQAISPSDVPHFIHEDSQLVNRGGYVHTGEGASRTHELTVLFYGPAPARGPAQLNSLTQHPFVLRQSPAHALRGPLFGFHLSPRNPEKYPDIERALDHYGRASFSRYPQTQDYGFLRFGMQRMNYPGVGLYRWLAGMQYNQQIIPWLLFLRGGDREFFEEAVNTGSYARDMHVNHYKKGATPGYMSFVAGMPMPQGPTFSAYNMKINFLALYHHLTGDRRARETMELGIEGTKKAWGKDWSDLRGDPVARQLYGMNSYFADAYEETADPELKVLARRTLDRTLDTHWDPGAKTFAGNDQYLYKGLVPMFSLFPDPRLRTAMLENLNGRGLPGLEWGGPADGRPGIPLQACAWAYEQTGDQRYARILWDATRTMADMAPDHDWSSPSPVKYPLGHFAGYPHRILPMLVGLGVVDRNNLSFPPASSLHDLFVTINEAGSTGTAYAQAEADGELRIRLMGMLGREISAEAFLESTGEKVADLNLQKREEKVLTGLRTPTTVSRFEDTLVIPNAKKGDVFRLEWKSPDKTAAILALSDEARIVHQIRPDMLRFFGHGNQYYTGSRLFAKMKQDTLRLTRNRENAPFTVRDAETHEILARADMLDPLTTEYAIGKGRMIELVIGAGRDTQWKFQGIEPYVSARGGDWFLPGENAPSAD